MQTSNLLRGLLGAALLAGVTMVPTGCTPSYWATLAQTSEVIPVVTTPGRVEWKFNQTDGAWSFTRISPVVQLSLTEGSSPVDIRSVSVSYITPFNQGASGVNTAQFFNFASTIQPKVPLSLPLIEIITQELINASDRTNGQAPVGQLDVLAVVQFSGRNKLAQTISWQVNVPITFSYED